MSTARDIMTPDLRSVAPERTLREAARLMRDLGSGTIPVCDDVGLLGVVTDHAIVVRCVALGGDPGRMTAGEVLDAHPATVDVDADLMEVLTAMSAPARRLLVSERGRLVGVIERSDVTRHQRDEAPSLHAVGRQGIGR